MSEMRIGGRALCVCWIIGIGLQCLLAAVAFAGSTERTALRAGQLLDGQPLDAPVAAQAFAPLQPDDVAAAHFEGWLALDVEAGEYAMRVLRDDNRYAADKARRVGELPAFRFRLLTVGEDLVPVQRGPVRGAHPHWEWVLEPGRVWREAGDRGYSRAALPFSLQQRGENCVHNGLLSFLYREDGTISDVALQIASETCLYFKFDLWGRLPAHYTPRSLAQAESVAGAHRRWLAARLPVKPVEQLERDYPGADAAVFSGAPALAPADMTAYGLVLDGVHYLGGCQTRFGPHPYCQSLNLPSYSLAKSLVAGLGLMRLEKLFPGVAALPLERYVPACRETGRWTATSFLHALDMATGLYDSPTYNDDEAALQKEDAFFAPTEHAAKIDFACTRYPRQVAPGERWVYHTSDTYLLGTAMNAFLAREAGPGVDLHRDILLPWWEPLHLSATSRHTRRTYDSVAQPFTGYGLTLLPDDIARLASFILSPGIRDEVDGTMLAAALQRDPAQPGLQAMNRRFRYQHGFWALVDFQPAGCEAPMALPFMLGYGGINVVLLPNQTVYYYFSDGGRFSWADAARESSRLKSFCPAVEESSHER
ncbi:MAG: hypothetical protein CME59_13855 [Halioglobus sp.]|nr:hypothetical protein [Halioglobus sp.]